MWSLRGLSSTQETKLYIPLTEEFNKITITNIDSVVQAFTKIIPVA